MKSDGMKESMECVCVWREAWKLMLWREAKTENVRREAK